MGYLCYLHELIDFLSGGCVDPAQLIYVELVLNHKGNLHFSCHNNSMHFNFLGIEILPRFALSLLYCVFDLIHKKSIFSLAYITSSPYYDAKQGSIYTAYLLDIQNISMYY